MPTPTKHDEQDLVDEASWESFPASDPPAWGSFHAAPSETTVCPPELQPARSNRMGLLKRIGIGLGALAAMLSFVEGARRVRNRC